MLIGSKLMRLTAPLGVATIFKLLLSTVKKKKETNTKAGNCLNEKMMLEDKTPLNKKSEKNVQKKIQKSNFKR